MIALLRLRQETKFRRHRVLVNATQRCDSDGGQTGSTGY